MQRKKRKRVRDELEGKINELDRIVWGQMELLFDLWQILLHLAHPPAGARALSLTSIRGKWTKAPFIGWPDQWPFSKHTNEICLSSLLPQIATKGNNVFSIQHLASRVWTFLVASRSVSKTRRRRWRRRRKKGRIKRIRREIRRVTIRHALFDLLV